MNLGFGALPATVKFCSVRVELHVKRRLPDRQEWTLLYTFKGLCCVV